MTEQQPEDASDTARRDEEPDEELDQGAPGDIGDADLPDDLQPTEDNPLARHPGQSGDEDDEIGTDREGEAETAPLTEEDSDYGERRRQLKGPDVIRIARGHV